MTETEDFDRFDGGIDLYDVDEDDPWIVDDQH